MSRFSKSLRLLIAFTLASAVGFASYAGSAKANANGTEKSAEKSQLVKSDPYDFHFLSKAEVASLAPKQRAQYIRAVRKAIVGMEGIQNLFKNPTFAVNPTKNKYEELFAYIMGEEANANDPETRGATLGDACISAYGVSHYPTSGVRQPGQCVCQQKCRGVSGPGCKCDPYLSGVPDSPESCIDFAQSHHATKACEDVRQTLNGRPDNMAAVKRVMAKAQSVFDFRSNVPPSEKKQIPAGYLNSEEAKSLIRDLERYSFNDDVKAELTAVEAFYKKNNLALPVVDKTLKDQYDAIDLNQREEGYNRIQTSLRQQAHAYVDHCNHALSNDEVKNLCDPKWAARASQMGRKLWELENIRIEAIKGIFGKDDGTCGDIPKGYITTPTIKENLEKEECEIAESRIAQLVAAVNAPADSSPLPPTTPEPQPIKNVTQVTASGCSSNVCRVESHLEQASARCMMCMTDHQMSTIADDDYHKYFSGSTKWMGLLSSLVLACGDGVADNTAVLADRMACFTQAFGVCSAETYDWDPNGKNITAEMREMIEADKKDTAVAIADRLNNADISKCDSFLTKTWAGRGFWPLKDKEGDVIGSDYFLESLSRDGRDDYIRKYNENGCGKISRRMKKRAEKGKISMPDMNLDFSRIYGISYDTATKLFCSGVKKTWWTGRTKSVTPNQGQCDPAMIASMRKQLTDKIPSLSTELKKSPSGKPGYFGEALLTCIKEAATNAEDLMPSSNTNVCVQSGNMGDGYNENRYTTMLNRLKNGSPAAIWDTGSCFISKQYETVDISQGDNKLGHGEVGEFIDPCSKNGMSRIRAFNQVDPTRGMIIKTFPPEVIAQYCAAGNSPELCTRLKETCKTGKPCTLNFEPGQMKYLNYSYLDQRCEKVSGSPVTQTEGSKSEVK